MLTPSQYALLSEVAERTQQPLSILIRKAIEAVYFAEATRQKRYQALDQLLALQAPVADWEEMEEEITRGALA